MSLYFYIIAVIVFILIIGVLFFVFRKKNKTYEDIYNKGIDLHIKGKFEEAKQHFLKAIELDLTRFEAYYNLGLSFLSNKEINQAEKAFLKAIGINREDADSFYNLGLIEYERKNFKQAIQYYEKSLSLNNNDLDCLYNSGITCMELKDFDLAIFYFSKAIVIEPENPLYKMGIANAYDQKSDRTGNANDIKSAINAYKDVIITEPENEEALYRLAICSAKSGLWEDSVYYSERVLKINPSSANAYNQYGLALYCKGDIYEAIKLYEKALSLDNNNSVTYTNLAFAYEKIDETAKAIELFKQFLLKFPDNDMTPKIKEHLNSIVSEN